MGVGHGGRRVGAGRKPKSAAVGATPPRSNVVALAGGRHDHPVEAPPSDLPEEQRAFWRTYAPIAAAAGTLTDQTVGSFRLLCELEAEKTAVKATIEKDGRTYLKVVIDGAGQEHQELKAHPLTNPYRQLAQRVEALMARFGLAPFGKPLVEKRRAAAANPFAAVMRR